MTNTFDGVAEGDAILAQLSTLCGGRIYDGGIPDDTDIPRDAMGKTLPFIEVVTGTPIMAGSGRGIALTEQQQPQILPVTVSANAGDIDACKQVYSAVMAVLLGWSPNSNSTPLKSAGGSRPVTQSRPSTYSWIVHFTSTINQAPVLT